MLHLLKIDLKKMTGYRTFWVVSGLYFMTLGFGTLSGLELLKWLERTFGKIGQIDITRIPLYHFPDVWLNLIWFSGLIKIVLGVMVVISVTNEYAYRTLRQNIIDGLSRGEFLVSKILTNAMLSLMSVTLIFITGLFTGLIYSPEGSIARIATDLEFFFAYFLEIFFFLSFALMVSVFIQRSGLAIIVLLLAKIIELIISAKLNDYIPEAVPYLPFESIWNLIKFPLPRYWFQEIEDYLTPLNVVIVIGWIAVFNLASYWKLRRSDI